MRRVRSSRRFSERPLSRYSRRCARAFRVRRETAAAASYLGVGRTVRVHARVDSARVVLETRAALIIDSPPPPAPPELCISAREFFRRNTACMQPLIWHTSTLIFEYFDFLLLSTGTLIIT